MRRFKYLADLCRFVGDEWGKRPQLRSGPQTNFAMRRFLGETRESLKGLVARSDRRPLTHGEDGLAFRMDGCFGVLLDRLHGFDNR